MSLVKYNRTPSLFKLFFDDPGIKDIFLDNGFEEKMNFKNPLANIKENENEFALELVIPGMAKEYFSLALDNDILKITAESKKSKDEEGDTYHLQEFTSKSYERSFTLPKTVNKDKIEAKYADGILHVILPKDEEAKAKPAREIKVG